MNTQISGSILLLALALHPAAAACPDDFSGTSLAAPWTFVDADGTAGGAYALAGGKLELAGRGRDAFNAVNEFVGIVRSDIAGDFDVSVKLESQARTHDWAQAGLLAAHDHADLAKGGYVALDISPGNGYTLFYDAAAPQGTLDKLQAAGVPVAYPSWIRLAKSGAKFTAWYRKQESQPWTQIGEPVTPLGTPAASRIALFSLSHDQTKDGKAVFDDFACLHHPTSLPGPRARRVPAGVSSSAPAFDRIGLTGRRIAGARRSAAPGWLLRP